MLVCPYCDDLDPLRDDCTYCGGFGKVPGPKLYAVENWQMPKPGAAESWREFWRKSFWFVSVLMALGCVGICLGLPWLFRLFGW